MLNCILNWLYPLSPSVDQRLSLLPLSQSVIDKSMLIELMLSALPQPKIKASRAAVEIDVMIWCMNHKDVDQHDKDTLQINYLLS